MKQLKRQQKVVALNHNIHEFLKHPSSFQILTVYYRDKVSYSQNKFDECPLVFHQVRDWLITVT